MSIHHSFKRKRTGHRTVRKRWERLRSLILQQKWNKEHHSVFTLPKERNIRLKLKKEKKEETVETPLALETFKSDKKKKKSKDVGKIK